MVDDEPICPECGKTDVEKCDSCGKGFRIGDNVICCYNDDDEENLHFCSESCYEKWVIDYYREVYTEVKLR